MENESFKAGFDFAASTSADVKIDRNDDAPEEAKGFDFDEWRDGFNEFIRKNRSC